VRHPLYQRLQRQQQRFYLRLSGLHEQTLALLQRAKLLPHFAERSRRAVTDTNGSGWGFHGTLAELRAEYYQA
jgi:hypothetical protein